MVAGPLIVGFGSTSLTRTLSIAVFVAPAMSVTVSFTGYVPAVAKSYDTVAPVWVLPSGSVQR